MSAIPLYFIAGFLGSGKTTVLNRLLATLGDRTAGLIINEFGSIGVDSGRIGRERGEIFELNNGQIFCACLAGPLSAALVQLAEKKPDLILAECSGLSKPALLKEMAAGVEKTTSGAVSFGGLITVADAPRLPVLSQTVLVIREQIAYAGAVILNKTDQCNDREIAVAEAVIHKVNPLVPVRKTAYGDVSFDDVEAVLSASNSIPELNTEFMGWGAAGRPKNYLLHSSRALSRDRLNEFLAGAARESYRIKGALASTEGGYFQVDCVGDSVLIEPLQERPENTGLVVIVPGDGRGEEYFRKLFSSCWPVEAS